MIDLPLHYYSTHRNNHSAVKNLPAEFIFFISQLTFHVPKIPLRFNRKNIIYEISWSRERLQIIRKHHTAQRLLRSLAVANPFSKYLSYPNQSLRTRRDHKKYLGLIRAIAFLYQYQKARKSIALSWQKADSRPLTADSLEYIEVTLDDIDKANKLANEVLGQSLDELAKPSRTLLSAIYNMVKEISEKQDIPVDEVYFTRRMIREHIGWTDWQVRAHIKQLEDMEYVCVRIGARGKEYAYALHYQGQGEENDKCYLNLTPVEEIRKLIKKEEAEGKKNKED